jgi:hypothetical protein
MIKIYSSFKAYEKLTRTLLMALFCLVVPTGSFATQLSGSYTIDSAGTASATVFKNFASAVTYMTGSGTRSDGGPSNSSPFGVNGPVIFNVSQGTYTEQVDITAITGASSTNTITFDGGIGNTSTRVLQFAGTATTNAHTLRFNGSSYINFRNITIKGTSASYGMAVHLLGTCTFISIKQCSLMVQANATTANIKCIVANNSADVSNAGTCGGTQGVVNNFFVDSNYISGGYVGLFLTSSSSSSSFSNPIFYIRWNTFENVYYYGINCPYGNGYLIQNNYLKMSSTNANSYGIYHCNGSTANKCYIIGNTFENCGAAGLYFLTPNYASGSIIAYNYFKPTFQASAAYGMYIPYTSGVIIAHNTILMNTLAGTGITQNNISGYTGWTVVNNIVMLTNPNATGLAFSCESGVVSASTMNYNTFVKTNASSADLAKVNGVTYQKSNFIGGGGMNNNSWIDDPALNNPPTDIRPNALCQKGTNITLTVPGTGTITTDINGATRGNPPQIGAAEATSGLSSDVAIVGFAAPAPPLTSGYQDVKVVVRNNGTSTVTSMNVSVTVGTTTNTIGWTGSLIACAVDTVTFTSFNQFNFNAGCNNATAYIDYFDLNRGNDTLRKTFCTPMSGAYSIGTGGDFTTFNAAVSQMATGGISGPVTFNVLSGTFNEQVDIPSVAGASSTNTITFDGGAGNASTRILQFTATGTSNAHTLRFTNTKYVTVQNLTIKSLGTSYGLAVHLNGADTFISVKQCSIIVQANATTSNIKCIVINNSADVSNPGTCSGTQGAVNNIYIDSNYVSGGYVGIYLTSSSYNTSFPAPLYYIRWNYMENIYYYGFNSPYGNGYLFQNNYLKMSTGNANSYGIYHCNGGGSNKSYVIGNTFENVGTGAIYLNSANYTSGSIIAYNYIKPTFTATSPVGIFMPYTSGLNIWHNTILMNAAGGTGITMNGTTGYSGNNVQNNIIMLTSPSATGLTMSFETNELATCNYNTLVKNNSSSPDLAKINGNTYQSYNIIGGGGFNANSFTDNPGFVNAPTDIHPTALCQKGNTLTITVPGTGNITTDIYGSPRGTPPQIGAAEGSGGYAVDMATAAYILPVLYAVSPGAQDIKVVFRNSGNNTITYYEANISMGTTTNTIYRSSVSIPPCGTDTVLFTGGNQLTLASGSNVIKAFVSNPNFAVDSNRTNDSLIQTFCTYLPTGSYTIDPASSASNNFPSVSAALASIACGGIGGPVVFNIATGTYTGQYSIALIPGASATNTITFQSAVGNPDSVVLQYNSTSTTNYVFALSGAKYLWFRNLTIQPQNTSYGTAVTLFNNASSDSFYNVTFRGVTTTTNTTNLALITMPSSTISNYISFDNCRMINGAYGTYIQSSSTNSVGASSQGLNISNCTFTNQYAYGTYSQYLDGIKLRNNVITTNSTNTNYYGMYNYWIMILSDPSKPLITGNRISGSVGGYGMYNYYIGVNSSAVTARRALFANNVISVGTGSNTTVGILDYSYSTGSDYLNNSVNIGSSSTANTTAAGYFIAPTGSHTIQDNVFAASNGAAALRLDNYAYYLTCNYNNLYTTGTNLAYNSATPYTSLVAWRTASNRDANSISYKPGFTSNTDLTPNPADSSSWSLNGYGVYSGLNPTDINGVARPSTFAAGVPDIGAYEFTPTSVPPLCQAIPPVFSSGDSVIFTFATDTVAKIIWDPFISVPTSIAVRRYAGVNPPSTTGAQNVMNVSADVTVPTGTYSYSFVLNYKDQWIGTNPNESDLRLAKYNSSTGWIIYQNALSSVDTIRNQIRASGLTDFSIFTGTNNTTPLPVNLVDFTGNRVQKNVALSWTTASEQNSNRFEIERSFDGRKFETAGTTRANGRSSVFESYQFTDMNIVSAATGRVIYYRLKMVDNDNSFAYSKTIAINLDASVSENISVYPNPFSSQLLVKFATSASGTMNISLLDMAGKSVAASSRFIDAGNGSVILDNMNELLPGIYFVVVDYNGARTVEKVVKQ